MTTPRESKHPYEPPTLRKLNREQAALFLLGHAWDGDPNANELLHLVFPDSKEENPEPGAARRRQ